LTKHICDDPEFDSGQFLKVYVAIKADKAKTLDQINKDENGFLVGDIYPFCFNLSDGLLVANANLNVKQLLGKDVRTFKDPTGDLYGPRLYDEAKEGQINEVSYMSPKPGADKTWVPKASLVTAVTTSNPFQTDRHMGAELPNSDAQQSPAAWGHSVAMRLGSASRDVRRCPECRHDAPAQYLARWATTDSCTAAKNVAIRSSHRQP